MSTDILTKEQQAFYRGQYQTPPHMFDQIENLMRIRYGIDHFWVDVAASEDNRMAPYWFCSRDTPISALPLKGCAGRDGLQLDWRGGQHEAAWCNPPFKQFVQWLGKAYTEALMGAPSVVISTVDYSTAWYQFADTHATAQIIIPERINYIMHPKIAAHKKALGESQGGNPGCNWAWVFMPDLLDRPGGAEIIKPEWQRKPKGKDT